jgi:signal transduction histidine kinase
VTLLLLYVSGFFIIYAQGYWPKVMDYYQHPYATLSYLAECGYCIFMAFDSLKRIKRFRAKEQTTVEARIWLVISALRWLFIYAIVRTSIVILFLILRNSFADYNIEIASADHAYLIVVNTLLIGLLAIMAYFTLRNPMVFNQVVQEQTVEQKVVMAMLPEDAAVTVKMTLSNLEMKHIIERLQQYMDREKP